MFLVRVVNIVKFNYMKCTRGNSFIHPFTDTLKDAFPIYVYTVAHKMSLSNKVRSYWGLGAGGWGLGAGLGWAGWLIDKTVYD